jgi:predicted porin
MKKSLIALGALSEFATAAQAQSSVTVYGILDAGYTSRDSTALKYTSSTNSISQTKTDTSGVTGVGSESTSRLGFRGTEDLGGGLKANFVFETQLNPAEATITAWNNRQAFVGLSGGFGSLNVGMQYTPHHIIAGGFSASTLPNVVGDVMYVQGGGGLNTTLNNVGIVGRSAALADDGTVAIGQTKVIIDKQFTDAGNNAVTIAGNVATTAYAADSALAYALSAAQTSIINARLARANNTSYTVRQSNTVAYTSPVMNGFTVGAQYSAPTSTKVEGGNETETTATALSLGYTAGKFAAAVAYNDIQQKSVGAGATTLSTSLAKTTSYAANSATAATTAAGLASAGTDAQQNAANTWTVDSTESMAALSYDLGVAKVSYIYAKRDAKDTVSDLSEKTTHNFGVKAPFGKTTAFAIYSMGETKVLDGTANAAKFDLDGIQVGASYAMSKRTDVYAIYGTAKMDNKANTNDIKDKQYAVGVRHSF